jgi:HPt (histidine-containing phosphotransfer) domain-containing protein
MATTAVQSAPGLPISKPSQISSKREFEKIILDICRLYSKARSCAGEYVEVLIGKSEEITQKQTRDSKLGSYTEMLTVGGALGGAALFGYQSQKPDIKTIVQNFPAILDKASTVFQIGSKVGDIGKTYFNSSQYSHQMEKEKIQHATTQLQTWANGLQDTLRNLEASKQRLQQLEDAANR